MTIALSGAAGLPESPILVERTAVPERVQSGPELRGHALVAAVLQQPAELAVADLPAEFGGEAERIYGMLGEQEEDTELRKQVETVQRLAGRYGEATSSRRSVSVR